MFNPTYHSFNIGFATKCGMQSTWGQKSVSGSETHFHKWGRVQKIEPNDSQVHSHFGSCISVKVPNIYNLSWKNKQTSNLVPMRPLQNSWSLDA